MVRVAFTGHRPDKLGFGYNVNSEKYNPLKEELRKILLGIELAKGEIEEAYTGGALGFDWISFIVLESLKDTGWKGKSILAVPFKQQDAKWTEYDAETYRKMKLRADEVVYVDEVEGYQPRNNVVGAYSGAKMQLRNMYMVDHADVVIACWDRVEKGGTWNCVEYALNKGKVVIAIHPTTYNKTTMWRSLPGEPVTFRVGDYESYRLMIERMQ